MGSHRWILKGTQKTQKARKYINEDETLRYENENCLPLY